MLYIVPTPIGNLEDITLRALRVLKEVDLIAAEDTRHSKILLNHYEIHTPLESFHSYSDERKTERLISALKDGKDVALISDAGMPGISDPGYRLIARALEEDVSLTVLPGANAAITALVASGFPMDKFTYIGFLPLKKRRKTTIAALNEESRSVILYEAPHRILKTLGEFVELLGEDREIAVCREITKKFEEIFRGTLKDAYEHFSKKQPRGEFTLVLKPAMRE